MLREVSMRGWHDQIGVRDEKAGALGSVYDIGRDGRLNHRIEVVGGILEDECASILREFFRGRRGG